MKKKYYTNTFISIFLFLFKVCLKIQLQNMKMSGPTKLIKLERVMLAATACRFLSVFIDIIINNRKGEKKKKFTKRKQNAKRTTNLKS